jgi:hypothetical protein
MGDVEGLVEEFIVDLILDKHCPSGFCSVDEEEEEQSGAGFWGWSSTLSDASSM